MAVSVTNYTGNAGLGSGSNASIPVGTNTDLDNLVRVGDQIMYQNMAQNKYLYDQKVKDRDKLLEALDSGDIKVGDILEQDMPTVKEGLNRMDDAFWKRVKAGREYGIGSDAFIDANNEYKKESREAQDRATQAQANKVFYDKANLALSQEKLPRRQEARKKHLDESMKKGFYSDKTDYQQTLDYDWDPFKAYVTKETTVVTDPNDPLKKITRTTVNVPATLQKAKKDFMENNEPTKNQQALINEYQKLSPQDRKEQIISFNNRLKPLGIEIKTGIMPDGTIAINETAPDFAAKWAIALDPQLETVSSEFDKGALDVAKFKHDKAIDWTKLGLEKRKLDEADSGDLLAADGILREITDIINKGDKPENQVTVVDKNDNSYKVFKIGDPTILQKFANIDKEGKTTKIPDEARYNPLTNEIDLVYFSKIGDKIQKNKAGGNFIDEVKTLNSRTWANMVSQRTFGGNDRGKVNEIVQSIITKNGGDLYKISKALEGKGGEAKPDQNNYYNDEKNLQSRKGNKITYKDGTVWEISGNEMKKIK